MKVRQPAAAAAADYARKHHEFSVGLHLDLGEWVYQKEEWVSLYSVVDSSDAAAVTGEVLGQISEFERLLGRPPSHIDSHQHVHRQEPVRSIVIGLSEKLGVPLREQTLGIQYCGDFYGQTGEGETMSEVLSVQGLKSILSSLAEGVTELGCHPGYDDGLRTAYRTERALEVQVLCAPETRANLTELNIRLCSFHDVGNANPR